MIRTFHESLLVDGFKVPVVKLCVWFDLLRRKVYCKPTKSVPKIDPRFGKPIKAMIKDNPLFGYCTLAFLLGLNKIAVQWIFRLKNWPIIGKTVHRTVFLSREPIDCPARELPG
ncbi:hypothetical protein [Paracoccus aestuariivivens]|uniref:Uncharacterized protein n=1 Tax=Paracoccus aestuariivivens TaxID=1820333 RepID=A0A6L6JJM6_9RHOB|nr:hypothetical protein [Paracoccus aestuariivivens]MTH80354.1 hypothetical protein [Paracoccus aestuariivivens]